MAAPVREILRDEVRKVLEAAAGIAVLGALLAPQSRGLVHGVQVSAVPEQRIRVVRIVRKVPRALRARIDRARRLSDEVKPRQEWRGARALRRSCWWRRAVPNAASEPVTT